MKVLIVGLGSIGKKHLAALKSIDSNIQIFALRSGSRSNSIEDVTNIYSLKEIAGIKFDFAIISNPTSEHSKTIIELLEFRFPLFIEKPLSNNLNISEVVNKIDQQGIITYVACNLRFLECINYTKQFIESSKARINEVNVYCGSFLPDWRPGTNFRESYSANEKLGGGVHLDLIHEIDYIYWLFGNPKSCNKILKSQSTLNINAIDYANYLLEFDGFCTNIVLNYYRKDPKRTLEVVFEHETWQIDLIKNNITVNNKEIFSSTQQIIDTYKAQLIYFINKVKENASTMNSIHDAYNVLKISL